MAATAPGLLAPVSVHTFAAPDGIAHEDAQFRAGGDDRAQLLLWSQSPCLVTSAMLARSRNFAWACEDSASRLWPVVVRGSGGGTVFHGPDVLCISLIERVPAALASVERAYAGLCALVLVGLSRLGLAADVGPMPLAPCDGRFNILLHGRKLAGTAARIRYADGDAIMLAHATLAVGGDVRGAVAAVERFENAAGLATSYAPDCMTTLAEHLGPATPGPITPATVAAAIGYGFNGSINLMNGCEQ